MNLDDILAATRDVGDAPDGARDHAKAQTLSATQASVDRITYLSKARVRRRRLVRVVAAGAAAAAVAVAVVRLNATPVEAPRAAPGVEAPHAAPPVEAVEFTTASQVLTAAARSAGDEEDLSSAKYWRVESQYQQDDDPVSRRIFWQGHTSPGYLYDEGFGDDRLTKMPKATFSFDGQKSLTWDELTQLTLSPEELVARLRTATDGFTEERGPDYYAFEQLTELLGESPAPPDLRKALWKAAALLDGTSNEGPTTDALGRSGYAISRAGSGTTYIVAPDTGELLEYRIRPIAPATSTYRLTYLSRGPADTAHWPE